MNEISPPREFIILADESADWHIAGLRQLDRLLLAINESATTQDRPSVRIFWKDGVTYTQPRTSDARFIDVESWNTGDSVSSDSCLLSTHVCLFGNGLDSFCEKSGRLASDLAAPLYSWTEAFERHQSRCQEASTDRVGWRFVETAAAIDAAETDLLKSVNEPQDGFVSTWINRPISRALTRHLLRFPIGPDQFTFAILVLPVASAAFLVRGDPFGFVVGAALFQVFSVLDGCDGEIARAKYQDSSRGAAIDNACDHVGNILFLTGLSIGLYRHHDDAWGQRYLLEGIVCAIVITLRELVLWRWQDHRLGHRVHVPAAYARHRGMREPSGTILSGTERVSWIVMATKRDVAILVFLILAIAGLPQWIVHLWLAVSLGSILLAGIAMIRAAKLSGT